MRPRCWTARRATMAAACHRESANAFGTEADGRAPDMAPMMEGGVKYLKESQNGERFVARFLPPLVDFEVCPRSMLGVL